MPVSISSYPRRKPSVEIVERKGLGHPDTICDGVMESVSIALAAEYMRRFGRVLHYNIDKGLLVAGSSKPEFGGGKVTAPMRIVFGDRATARYAGERIDIAGISKRSAKAWLSENLRFIDAKHMDYDVAIKPGSEELTGIFGSGGPLANDTSACVGYAPLSQAEEAVLAIEHCANSKAFKKSFPESGEDVKVMGMRRGDELDLRIAMAFVDRFVESEEDYFRKKSEITDALMDCALGMGFKRVLLSLNSLDRRGVGAEGAYLTVTGTSAENADSGQVGRGNSVNGLIPLNRPTSNEAAAGKNPYSHVGKIYNVLAGRIADDIVQRVDGVDECYVWLLSQIGKPVDEPVVASAELCLAKCIKISEVQPLVEEEFAAAFDGLPKFLKALARGDYRVY